MNNKKFWFAAMLFVILGIGSGIGTYAIYKLTAGGTASVNTANFAVSVNGSEISEKSQTFSLSSLNWTNTLGTQVATGKIAPGSTATLPLIIDATGSQLDVDYTITITGFDGLTATIQGDLNDTPSLVKYGTIPYSDETNGMVKSMNLILTWSGSLNDIESKNSTDLSNKNQNKTITITLIATQSIPSTYTYGDVVYYNPIDGGATNTCISVTGNCMKFNVVKDNGSTVVLQLDHNIVNKVAWVTQEDYNDDVNWGAEGNTDKGPITANNALASATSNWNNIIGKARMVTKDEVLEITDGAVSNLPAWLIQNTNENSYGPSNLGYWTSTPNPSNSARVSSVGYNTNLGSNSMIYYSNVFGARPVITVPKTKL